MSVAHVVQIQIPHVNKCGNVPIRPMFNIPETFGKALSYEGQINAIVAIIKDIVDEIGTINDRLDVLENE